MIIALDASVAVGIALNRGHNNRFIKIFRDSDLVLAPDISSSKITNIF